MNSRKATLQPAAPEKKPAAYPVNAADRYRLSLVAWQFFMGLNFRDARYCERRELARFTGTLKHVAMALGVAVPALKWGLKLERGADGCLHFHAVLAGFPARRVTAGTCERLHRAWLRKSGGDVWSVAPQFVQIFDLARETHGLDYLAKLPDPRDPYFNSPKFGVRGANMFFSDDLSALLQSR